MMVNILENASESMTPAPLADGGTWEILEKYLTMDMTYPQLEEAFSAYLGDRYIFDDWKDARDVLFSGDGDDGDNSITLANLRASKTSHIPLPLSPPRTDGPLSSTPIEQWCRLTHFYVFYVSNCAFILMSLVLPASLATYSGLMHSGSVALLDRLHLPNNQTVRDLNHDGKVVGCSYKGEQYYMGLVLKHFHHGHLELVASPHANDIQLHMQSRFDTPFIKKTLAVFSMQFLRIGNLARVISGELRSKIGTVVLTDHASGSICLEIILDGHRSGIDIQLEDIERVFCVGNEVRVVAGPYLGLEGHIIQISDDMFHVCQDGSKEELFISRYYLDCCPLHHTLQPWLHTLQHFEPPPEYESLQVGDHIEVLAGEHSGKCGIMEWILGGIMLWFRDVNPVLAGDDVESSVGSLRIQGAMSKVIQYLESRTSHNQRTYDHSLVIGQEVFIVGGELKGYRATLYDISSDTCIIALNGRAHTTLRRHDIVTSLSPWTTWTSNAEGIVDHLSLSVALSLSEFDPWILNLEDTQDNIDTRAKKLPDSVPLLWLMGKEYSLTFLLYHAVLKVAVGFMGGSVNGLAPENCVVVFCTSSNIGAAIQHYHIPAKDLSPAPPRMPCGMGTKHGVIQYGPYYT
ncbi:uncharacterized protein HD556DRAFT_1302308 [Suillus plorans]|uniref:KOW domain-containing protein n=1 Tax=Suillus plorans TaxID=116603 RepID=A0A9P7E2T1_9AGAM|nr:uncharacterized protein HD556DRAFT_1302308 [Suillus plorans]KAG1809890.1 hypothetical protein HD556DRAFT_1302308 [Suillus plorans]